MWLLLKFVFSLTACSRDFDINPNKQYYLASGGDDGCTKFWDVRNPSEPVISRSDHSHWYGIFPMYWMNNSLWNAISYHLVIILFTGCGLFATITFTTSWSLRPAVMLALYSPVLHRYLLNPMGTLEHRRMKLIRKRGGEFRSGTIACLQHDSAHTSYHFKFFRFSDLLMESLLHTINMKTLCIV